MQEPSGEDIRAVRGGEPQPAESIFWSAGRGTGVGACIGPFKLPVQGLSITGKRKRQGFLARDQIGVERRVIPLLDIVIFNPKVSERAPVSSNSIFTSLDSAFARVAPVPLSHSVAS